MSGTWNEVARLRFSGKRFRDHALDLSAITELRQFQKMVAETAKALWRAANPDRRNLPAHFEDRTRLCLRRIEDGSATTPLEVFIEEPERGELWTPEPVEATEAIRVAHEVFECVAADRPLPPRLPKELLEDYVNWGKSLAEGETLELVPTGVERPACVNAETRNKLARFLERPHSSTIDVTGEVIEADVRQRKSQIWLDTDNTVTLAFDEAQEELVTTALRDHRSVRIRVRGSADVSPDGRPLRFTKVEKLELVSSDGWEFDPDVPRIEDQIAEIWSDLPSEDWNQLPSDLSDQLDHYIYGTPKE